MRPVRMVMTGLGIAITVASLAYFAYSWARISEAKSWPKAQGQVIASNVTSRVQHSGKNRRRNRVYDAHVSYRYSVAGGTFDSNRIWLTEPRVYGTADAAGTFIAAYPPGRAVNVSYNPKDPADSALEIESKIAPILVITGVGILIILLSLFLPPLRGHSKPDAPA